MFSNAIPRDKFILGKIIGSYTALIIPLLIPILAGCLLLLIMNIPMTGEDWFKLFLILIAGFLLFGVFINLSVFLSTIVQRSSSSFLLLLVVWIMFILIIPKVAVMIAGRAVDVPSVDEINSKKNQYAQQISREFMNKMSNFKASPSADIMKEFQKFMEKNNTERDDKMKALTEKLNQERRNKQDVQENLAFTLSRISPSASYSFVTAELAGTSLNLVRNYREQAENYQKTFAKFQTDKTGGTTGGGMTFVIRTEGDNKPPEIKPSELPKFEFTQPRLSGSLSSSLSDIGLLFIFNLIFFGASYMRFLKFDLR